MVYEVSEPQERPSRRVIALRTLECKRLDALSRFDASRYAELCDTLGVSPELPDLYETGHAAMIAASSRTTESDLVHATREQPASTGVERAIRLSREEFWIEEARDVSRDLSRNAGYKRNMLRKYSDRFGPGGKQDVSRYDDTQVGFLWNRIDTTCRKKLKERS